MTKRKLIVPAGAAMVLAGVLVFGVHRWRTDAEPVGRDWPTWRFDAGRTGASPQELTAELHLQWVREYPPQSPAWLDPLNQDRMGYDLCYEPVVADSTMFVPFAGSDKVVALDTRTGREKWRFYADGPVRLPPTVWQGRVYLASDDGHLYCLAADSGRLHWKFSGGPSDLRVLGNQRLISAWPARGGPVVVDGTVYFAAGIWPFMGVFIHALDAESGRVVWTQDGCSFDYIKQPHNSSAFAGPAPQGPLTVAGDRLLVPTGRAVPACLDRRTGELLYYRLSETAKSGGAHVSALGGLFFNSRRTATDMYNLSDGKARIQRLGPHPVLTERALYFSGSSIVALDPASLERTETTRRVWEESAGRYVAVPQVRHGMSTLWKCEADASGAMIKAGRRLYAASGGTITAVDVPARSEGKPLPRTVAEVKGTVGQLLAADGRLFAITTEGAIYAFGARATAEPARHVFTEADPRQDDSFGDRVRKLVRDTKLYSGYCLVLGRVDVRLLEELASRTQFRIILIDPDEARVAAVRRRMDELGLYGMRVAAHAGDPMGFTLPPYLAEMTIVDDPASAGLDEGSAGEFLCKVFHSMRPYGGVACLALTPPQARALRAAADSAGLPGAELKLADDGVAMFRRKGALPGAGVWIGQYGDPANSVCSRDRLVKAPLGLLWFSSANNADVLPRHGHGPPEQVIGGRLFIQGTDSISARDVYTGRVLWKRQIEDLGTFGFYYDRSHNPDPLDTSDNQEHIPGANARGTNFVATAEEVYVLHRRVCLKLDAATGDVLTRLTLPRSPDAAAASASRPTTAPADDDALYEWGFLAVEGDLMIAGADPMVLPGNIRDNMDVGRWISPGVARMLAFNHSASRSLVVRDRHDGRILWSVTAEQGFRHNAIAIGGGRLFCIDMLPPLVRDALQRRGQSVGGEPAILAFDLRTGRQIWKRAEDVFGSWLSYSAEHDMVLQAGRPSRDMLLGEVRDRMSVHGAADGEVVWDRTYKSYGGPPILHGGTIFTQDAAYHLSTGLPRYRQHPLTGERIPWRYKRNYGCGTAVASEHLLTFRSAAAGFYDLVTDGGTGNIGGFRSGCTSNLIVADGVLNAPDYTRTCTCSYQNQGSLALIHMPDVEVWTFSALPEPTGRIRRLGLNLGAPGDRQAADGTLWLDAPSTGGPSPDVAVVFGPDQPRVFRRHSCNVRGGEGHPWVVASGLEGVRCMTVPLYVDPPDETPWWQADTQPTAPTPVKPHRYTLRLLFAEMREAASGERVFDVWLGDRKVLEGFDPVAEAGGPWRGVVRQFDDVAVERELKITLAPSASAPNCEPVLCGVQIIAADSPTAAVGAGGSVRPAYGPRRHAYRRTGARDCHADN